MPSAAGPSTADAPDFSPAPSVAAILRRIEAMGMRATERHWSLIPDDLARRIHPHISRLGDGLLTLMETSDALRMNRVTGLGHRGRAEEPMIDAIVARYRAARLKRFSLQLGPGPQAAEISRWLEARGFKRHGGTLLLLRDLRRPVPRVDSDLRVARARRADFEAVARILSEVFFVPASRMGWSLAALAQRENETFLARAGRSPAGVGTLCIERDLAWLGAGATLTRWRGRGAHAALIAARLSRAARAGCRWAWSETAEPKPGRPDGSRRNLARLGFEPVCVKPVFVWQDR